LHVAEIADVNFMRSISMSWIEYTLGVLVVLQVIDLYLFWILLRLGGVQQEINKVYIEHMEHKLDKVLVEGFLKEENEHV